MQRETAFSLVSETVSAAQQGVSLRRKSVCVGVCCMRAASGRSACGAGTGGNKKLCSRKGITHPGDRAPVVPIMHYL